jgi:hypothetical protein
MHISYRIETSCPHFSVLETPFTPLLLSSPTILGRLCYFIRCSTWNLFHTLLNYMVHMELTNVVLLHYLAYFFIFCSFSTLFS